MSEFRTVIEHGDKAIGWADSPTLRVGDVETPIGGEKGVGASALVWLLDLPYKKVAKAVEQSFSHYIVKVEGWPDHLYRSSMHGETTDYVDAVLIYALFAGDESQQQKALGWVNEADRIGDDVALALRELSTGGPTDEIKTEASRLLEEWRVERKKIPPHTEEELKGLVLDLLGNRIFTSAQVPDHENLGMIFMPLALGALSVPDAALAPRPNVPPEPELPSEPDLPPMPVAEKYPDPPELLVEDAMEIERLDHEIRWGRMKEGEVEKYKAEIEAENQRRTDSYEAAKKVLDDEHAKAEAEWQEKCDVIQEAYEDAVKGFDATVETWKEENAEVLAEMEEWEKLYKAWVMEFGGNIGIFYEYYDKAGPRSCNGYPMFMSFRILNRPDWERVWKAYEREAKRREEIEV